MPTKLAHRRMARVIVLSEIRFEENATKGMSETHRAVHYWLNRRPFTGNGNQGYRYNHNFQKKSDIWDLSILAAIIP